MKSLRIVLFLAVATATGPGQAQSVDQVTECMRKNIPMTVRIQTLEIVARDRSGGERMLRGKVYGTREKDQVRTMMRIDAPADLAGASYLVREKSNGDEMYMFLPALNKVRRITGASVDGQLWGTDLSYSDVKQMQNAFSGSSTKLDGAAKYEGRDVFLVSFTPGKEDASRYDRIRTHVDKKTCVALKVEFHEGGSVRKELVARPAHLKQSGKHWYLSEALIRDVKDRTQTQIKILGVEAGNKLSSRYFNPKTFYVGS